MRASVIGSLSQTEFVLQIGEAVCLTGKQLHRIHPDVMREFKVAQECTSISR